MTQDPWDSLGSQVENRALRSADRWVQHPWREGLKGWTLIVCFVTAMVLIVTVIANAIGVANIYWQAAVAKHTVGARVTQFTYGTENAVFNYSYFHQQCNNVVQDEQKVRNARGQLQSDQQTFRDTTDPIAQQQAGNAVTQDQAILTGTLDQLSNDVGDYNARSATLTASPFKAHNLPDRFSLQTNGELVGTPNCH